MKIEEPSDIKRAVVAALTLAGRSRHSLVQEGIAKKVWTRHTGESLLADDGTAMGRRLPTLANALAMLRLAGLEVVIHPRKISENP